METGATDASSSIASDLQQEVGSSDSEEVESTSEPASTGMPEELRSYLTDLRAFGANEDELRDAVKKYQEQPEQEQTFEYRIGDEVISQEEAQLLDTYQQSYNTRLREMAVEQFSLETYNASRPDRPLNLTNMSEAEKEQLRLETIDRIIKENDQIDAQDELAAGMYQERAEELASLRKFFSSSAGQAILLREGVRDIEEWVHTRNAKAAYESRSGLPGMPSPQLPGLLTATAERMSQAASLFFDVEPVNFEMNLDKRYYDAVQENRRNFTNEVRRRVSEDVKAILPEEQLTTEALGELEQRLIKDRGISLDLDGNQMYNARRTLTGSVWWDNNIGGLSASLAGMVRAGTEGFGLIDYEANAEGRRTLVQQWQDSSKAIMSQSIETPFEKLMQGDVADSIYDTTSMFGSSMPLMAVAIGTGIVTKSQKAVALATTFAGSATAYGDSVDEKFYKEMSGAQQAGYLLSMGIFEAAPAMVGAHIMNRTAAAMRAAGSAAQGNVYREMAKGFLVNTSRGILEEAVTEGVTAGGQYATTMFAKGQDPTYEGFINAVKEGAYAGGVLGGAISGGYRFSHDFGKGCGRHVLGPH